MTRMKLRPYLGYLVQFLGVVFFILTAGLSLAMRHGREIVGDAVGVLWLAAGVCGAVAFWLWKTGKQLRVISADELMKLDPRPPVLYLRSFQADAHADKAMQSRSAAQWLPMSLPQNLMTEEEQIAQLMTRVGPFVAIGRPGERLPQLGASRLYATDETWQGIILDLFQRSRLIVMRVGETEGFWWEVANASTLPDPTKVVFLLPTDAAAYERFRLRAEGHLPCKLPAEYHPKTMTDRSFGGMLWFEADWTPHLELCASIINTSRYSVAADMREKLAPVLDRLMPERWTQAPAWRRIAATLLDVVIFALLMACWAFGTDTILTRAGFKDGFAVFLIGAVLAFFIYFGALEAGSHHATPGKRILRLITLDKSGIPLAFQPAMLRTGIKMILGGNISLLLLILGKKTAHEYFTQSTVLYRETSGTSE